MNRHLILFTATSLVLSACVSKEKPVPNILLIMADDMGYSDLGCYGGEMTTPNLDSLAEEGIMYTSFYNTARCCPSRASLMTGLYPHEAGVGYMSDLNVGGGYQGYLNDSCQTIAEVLGRAGYYTAMTGKWHTGAVREAWPENRGFQHFFGIHHWVDSYFTVLNDCEIFEDGVMRIPETEHPALYGEEGREWYTTDVFTSKAISYMGEALEEGKPFFQYVAYNAPHWPLHAPADLVNKYVGTYRKGYEALREEKYQRMIDMGLISRDWKLPEQETPLWDTLSAEMQEQLDFYRAIYAAQIESLDQNIGRMVSFLREKGALDNTVIIFLSDNGCSAEPMNSIFGFDREKNKVENYDSWRRNPGRSGSSQGRVWSITSNTPFRKYKRFTHEGGISAPLIVHWPEGIRKPGVSVRLAHIVDIMATCADLGRADYPENKKPLRGLNLLEEGNYMHSGEHDYLFWEHEGHGALRYREWKIVNADAKNELSWELYNMTSDRTEQNDLSEIYPELKKEMTERWYGMALETGALPWPDWSKKKYNPVDKNL